MRLLQAESLQIFKIRDFRNFIGMRFFITLAIQMQFATLSLQIYYEYTNRDEFIVGLLGLAEVIPFVITSFYSGYVSDNTARKKIIKIAVFALTFNAILLFFNSDSNFLFGRNLGYYFIFGIVFLFGIIRSFLGATTHPFMSQIVPRNMYTHSATWNSSAWHLANILGPVLAGIVYSLNNQYHANWCHFIVIVLFLIAIFFILLIKHNGKFEQLKNKESVFESFKVGLNFVFSNKMVLSALSLDMFAVLFGGAVAILPAFTDKILGLGPEYYGILRTAPACGAVIMALIMAFYPPQKKAGVALLLCVAAFGIFTIGFALSTNFWLAFIMLFLTGAFDNVSVVVRHSILQFGTPDNMRGRVSAINSIFIGSSNEIGAFESGAAAKYLGLVRSILLGGTITMLTVGCVNWLNPKLKKLDLTKFNG
ncbi:MAG: MFS transporter [Bacteroidetes bacterium]|nr:MFS transporter [Bacteroidota bacterium]